MKNISLTFLLWKFIEAVLVAFVPIVFLFFVNRLFIIITISSHSFTEALETFFKYLLFSEMHMLGFQL